jgi:hypothetical protein
MAAQVGRQVQAQWLFLAFGFAVGVGDLFNRLLDGFNLR